jgi:uncharacterized membrane protein YhiD involved in acid resistance
MNADRDKFEDRGDPLAMGEPVASEDQERRNDDVRSAARQAVHRASSLGAEDWKSRLSGLSKNKVLGLGLILVGVVIVVLVGYLLLTRATDSAPQVASRPGSSAPAAPATSQSPQAEGKGESGLPGLFGTENTSQQEKEPWPIAAARITLKLALGALLAALLAFRPRRDMPMFQRNPYVAQTQILLAVVAAALMMIVADNAARAFGIFAAASLVRFRTNIRDPKEITVLLISLGIGLASGVGKVEVAIILSLFSLMVLSLLEYYEPEQIFRSMELTVVSRKIDETDEILREIFEKRNMISELRKVDREDPENPLGKIVYYVNVNGDLSTDKLSEEIFASDPDNIDSIQWDQKKTSSYVYR